MIAAYLLANPCGELLVVPRRLEERVARDLVAAGWLLYRIVRAG